MLLAVISRMACKAVISGCTRVLSRIARCVARIAVKRIMDRARYIKVLMLRCSLPCIVLMTLRTVMRQ